MQSDVLQLRRRQRRRLVQRRVGDPKPAGVLDQCRSAHQGHVLVGEPEKARRFGGQPARRPCVPEGVRGLQVREVGDGLEGPIQLVVAQRHAESGLRSKHRVPAVSGSHDAKEILAVAADQFDQPGIELPAATRLGHDHRCLRPARSMERDQHIGELDDSGRQGDGVAGEAAWPAATVPALEQLNQGLVTAGPRPTRSAKSW